MFPWAQPESKSQTASRSHRSAIFGRPFVKRFALCYRIDRCPVCLSVCPVLSVTLVWPDGWTDQYETWHAGRPRPYSVSWGPSSPQRGTAPQFLGKCLLRPNGWVDQNATWYGSRPRSRRLCVRWGPSCPPQKGHSPQFLAHIRCDETAGWLRCHLVWR